MLTSVMTSTGQNEAGPNVLEPRTRVVDNRKEIPPRKLEEPYDLPSLLVLPCSAKQFVARTYATVEFWLEMPFHTPPNSRRPWYTCTPNINGCYVKARRHHGCPNIYSTPFLNIKGIKKIDKNSNCSCQLQVSISFPVRDSQSGLVHRVPALETKAPLSTVTNGHSG